MTSAPVGWPEVIPPPGAPEWQRRAVAWLFDLCPGEYRRYDVLRRHPVLLARLAVAQVEASIEAARSGWSGIRVELRDQIEPSVIEAAISMYEREGARLSALVREVRLVEAALAEPSRLDSQP